MYAIRSYYDTGEFVTRALRRGIAEATALLERGLTVLASIGSTAPFIGLFGTVWGIMNAFTSIAAAKNTSLAVVAPGIAEALFATRITSYNVCYTKLLRAPSA